MSGIDRIRARIVTASSRRRGHHRVEIPQSDEGRRHSTADAGDLFDTSNYGQRRHSTVGPSDIGAAGDMTGVIS